jgi:hypothetical protein
MALTHASILETRKLALRANLKVGRAYANSVLFDRAQQQSRKYVRCRMPIVNNQANLWIIVRPARANDEMRLVEWCQSIRLNMLGTVTWETPPHLFVLADFRYSCSSENPAIQVE